jgi:ATP-dependent RNA helicase RhlE
MFFIQNADRVRMLAMRLRECSGPVLVFTRTKRMATKLNTKINKLGFAASEIHSNRSLGQRRHALEGFKRGRFQILIATDIAARGIDVPGIELVVNYDMPANSEDYVHRIGRTGRAGKDGHAISFVNSEQRASLKGLERFLKTKLTITPLPILPTEATLLKEADLQKLRNARLKPVETFGSEKPRERSSRRREYKQDYKKVASRRPGKKRFESNSDDSSANNPKSKRSRRTVNNPNNTQSSGSKKSNSSANSGSDSKEQKSFWSNFKKKRPAQNKSTGQSTSRRQRSKRKKTE